MSLKHFFFKTNFTYKLYLYYNLYIRHKCFIDRSRYSQCGEDIFIIEFFKDKISKGTYLDIGAFNPIKFNADEWVSIAKAAGMRYMVITSKHHDGFALFNSSVSDFNVVKATPFRRDIIRELEQACLKAGLDFGVYYSHALDWKDGGDSGMKDYGPENPK